MKSWHLCLQGFPPPDKLQWGLSNSSDRFRGIPQSYGFSSSIRSSVVSDSLWVHGLQHTRLPCPSPTPGVCSNSCPSSQWCHPTISSLSSPSPPAFNLSQHQGIFQWVSSSHQVAKVLEFQLQHQLSWTIKKAEWQAIDALELWCWRRPLRVPWTARRSNQSILKEINPEYSLDGWILKLKLQYFGHLMWRANSDG